MGRISPAPRGDGPFAQALRHADPASGLRGNGAVASLDRDPAHGTRARSTCPPPKDGLYRHLTGLLAALHPRPELLASRLLYRFGSLARIVHASEPELRQSADPGETWVDTLVMARQLVLDGMREDVVRTKLGDHPQALISYLLARMQGLREEQMLAVFADATGYIISEEVIAEGESGHVLVTPRRILGRAMKLDARRIVLAHNHPSGCAKPSDLDIKYTRLLADQAVHLGLVIEDHLIVGRGYVESMKQLGFLST